jgi:uncharacterized Fe-S cluster-containing radical SAM superfamily protein
MGIYKVSYRMQYAKKIGTSCAKQGVHGCIRGPRGPNECCAMACVDADLPVLFRDAHNSYAITLHVGHCNLDCKFCWAYFLRNDKNERQRDATQVFADIKCKYERIIESEQNRKSEPPSALIYSGLEPLITVPEIYETLKLVAEDEQLHQLGVLFRTNGIVANNSTTMNILNKVSDLELDCRFQVSLKGVNPQQFALLTGKSSALFKTQLSGYDQLLRIFGEENVMLTLGIYHCESGIRLGARVYDRFPLVLVDEAGAKIDFTDYGEDLLKPRYQALLSKEQLHRQYYEVFQTTEGEGRHHPQRDGIIRISCPLGRAFNNPRSIAACQQCDDLDCLAIKKSLRSW